MPRFFRRRADEEPDLESLDPSVAALSEESPDAARDRLERLLTARLRRALQDTERLTRRLADAEHRLDELEGRLATARAESPAPEPAPAAAADDDPDGARLVAARMLGAGHAQSDVEQYLREVYDIPDAAALVEAVRMGARQ
jgi:hypothetical protein